MSSEATTLVEKLRELAKAGRVYPTNIPKVGQDIIPDQLPVFAELLVVLAKELDKAQRKIEWLTVALTVMTGVLVADVVIRLLVTLKVI